MEFPGPGIPNPTDAVTRQESFARRVLALLPVSVFIYSRTGRKVIYCNSALANLLGYDSGMSPTEAGGLEDLIHPEDRESGNQKMEEYLSGRILATPISFECRMRHADGTWRWFSGLMAVFEREESGTPVSFVGVTTEVTDSKLAQERLYYEARHDSLTGLLNRRRFVEELSLRILRPGTQLSLCYCDIDHFKEVNDQYGHGAGDEALKAVARLLHRRVRRGDLVARLGGDEFCILLPGLSAKDSEAILNRIRQEIGLEQITGDHEPFSITASFGIAELRMGMTAEEFLQRADDALYMAKAGGRNGVFLHGDGCLPAPNKPPTAEGI